MHDDGGVGRLDHRRALDPVAWREQGSVVDRRGRRLPQVGPVDDAPAPAGFRIDLRVELFRHGELRPRRRGGGAQAQRHDLQPRLPIRRTAPVQLLIAGIEALVQRFPERTADAFLRQHHLDLVDLALVAHVERELMVPPRPGDAVAVHLLARPFLQGLERGVHARRVERARLDIDLLIDVQDIGRGRAERAPGRGDFLLRDDYFLHPELAGEHARVRRARAAERGENEVARIEALLDGRLWDDVGHLELGDPGDAARGFHERKSERRGDELHRVDGLFLVELDAPAEEVVRVYGAEDYVRVRHGGNRAALAVAHGA